MAKQSIMTVVDQETVRSEEDYSNTTMPPLPEEEPVQGDLSGKPWGFGLAVPVGDSGVSPLAEDTDAKGRGSGMSDQSSGEHSQADSITPTPGWSGSKFIWAGIALLFVAAAVIATAVACASGVCGGNSDPEAVLSSSTTAATRVPADLSFQGESSASVHDSAFDETAADRSTPSPTLDGSYIPSTGGVHKLHQLLL